MTLSSVHITVPRTARYYMIGTPSSTVRDVWIACHGYGQLAASFARPFEAHADTSRLIIVPEALSRFYVDPAPLHSSESAIGATWMTREDREVEIDDIVSYLDAVYHRVFELLAVHGVPRDAVRVHALGFSQGAAATSRWVARGSALVDHLVVWGSGIPSDVNLQALHERRMTLRIDIVYGRHDPLISAQGVAVQQGVLSSSGIPYEIRAFDGGHALNGIVLRELMAG